MGQKREERPPGVSEVVYGEPRLPLETGDLRSAACPTRTAPPHSEDYPRCSTSQVPEGEDGHLIHLGLETCQVDMQDNGLPSWR